MSKKTSGTQKLTTRDVLRVAVEADVDERTVRRRLRGQAVQPRNAQRIDGALEKLGFSAHVPE